MAILAQANSGWTMAADGPHFHLDFERLEKKGYIGVRFHAVAIDATLSDPMS